MSFSFGKVKSPFKEEKIHLAKKSPKPNKSLFMPPPTMIPIVGTMGPGSNHVNTPKPGPVHFDISGISYTLLFPLHFKVSRIV